MVQHTLKSLQSAKSLEVAMEAVSKMPYCLTAALLPEVWHLPKAPFLCLILPAMHTFGACTYTISQPTLHGMTCSRAI